MEAVDTLQGEAEEKPTTEREVEETTTESKSTSISLPLTVHALMEQRKSKNQRTLNDHVEALHLSLYEDEEYQQFIEAVYSEQAVEGSLIADDLEAARMIRDKARSIGDMTVGKQKLATLVKAMNVVLRRFGISRKERREA